MRNIFETIKNLIPVRCPECGHFTKRSHIIWNDHVKGIPSTCFECYEDVKTEWLERLSRLAAESQRQEDYDVDR